MNVLDVTTLSGTGAMHYGGVYERTYSQDVAIPERDRMGLKRGLKYIWVFPSLLFLLQPFFISLDLQRAKKSQNQKQAWASELRIWSSHKIIQAGTEVLPDTTFLLSTTAQNHAQRTSLQRNAKHFKNNMDFFIVCKLRRVLFFKLFLNSWLLQWSQYYQSSIRTPESFMSHSTGYKANSCQGEILSSHWL